MEFNFKKQINVNFWETETFQDKSFFEFISELVKKQLEAFEFENISEEILEEYSTSEMNYNQTISNSCAVLQMLLSDWNGECSEFIDYCKDSKMEYPNPFGETNQFLLLMTNFGVSRLCTLLFDGIEEQQCTDELKQELLERLENLEEPFELF